MNSSKRRTWTAWGIWLPVVALMASAACGEDQASSPADTVQREGLFGPAVASIELEVDYQAGAAPYVDFPNREGNPWTLTQANLEALFANSEARTLVIPASLAEMEALDDISGDDFTVDAIEAIAIQHRGQTSTRERRSFYVVFLDGYFADESGRRETVLGISLGDTGIIAMFKPVIGATRSARFVEQTTLIHEFGHAAGLVNNGLPLTSDHHDAENGAHCSNEDCVMYWTNEGAADLVQFVRRLVSDETTTVFGPECLADAAAAAQ